MRIITGIAAITASLCSHVLSQGAFLQNWGGTPQLNLHNGIYLMSYRPQSANGNHTTLSQQATGRETSLEVPFLRLWSDSLQSTANTVAITRNGTLLVGCGFQSRYGLLRSTDQGRNWTAVGPTLVAAWRLTINDKGWIYAAVWAQPGQALLRSNDDGLTWTSVTGPANSGLSDLDWGFDLAISPRGDYFFATNEGLFRSLQGDSSWSQTNNGIPPSHYRPTAAVVKSPVFFDNKIFLVRSYDLVDSTNSIMVSTDNGDTWFQTGPGIPAGTPLKTLVAYKNLLITGGYYLQYNPYGQIFPNNLYVSADTGKSWQVLYSNLCVHQIRSDAHGYLYAAVNKWQQPSLGGIYRSTDGGSSWKLFGLPTSDVWEIVFDDAYHCLAATLGYYWTNTGLYQSVNPVSSVENRLFDAESGITLYQNFPNPFNPSTTIQFSIVKSAYVKVEIYNALGQQVTQILSEYLPSGVHSVKWHSLKLPSGVYYYRLWVDGFIETKKLILAR